MEAIAADALYDITRILDTAVSSDGARSQPRDADGTGVSEQEGDQTPAPNGTDPEARGHWPASPDAITAAHAPTSAGKGAVPRTRLPR